MYKRQEINAGAFAPYLPEGAQLYKLPELPMVEFKKDGTKYKVTDTRLLNETGVEAIKRCILHMLNGGADVCAVELGKTIDDEYLNMIIDIVMGFRWESSKGGKNRFYTSGLLCLHTENLEKDGKRYIEFHLDPDFVEVCHEYKGNEEISLFDLIVAVEKRKRESFDMYYKECYTGKNGGD